MLLIINIHKKINRLGFNFKLNSKEVIEKTVKNYLKKFIEVISLVILVGGKGIELKKLLKALQKQKF